MEDDVDFVDTNTSKSRQVIVGLYSELNLHVCLLFNSEEITYKPPDISLMGRMLKMKFHVPDTGIYQYFTGKIVNYDGCSGKC